jgi:hypothetical protein
MRPGPTVLLVFGVSFLGIAAAAFFTRVRPVPKDSTSVEVGGMAPGLAPWEIRADVPRRILVGQTAAIQLELKAPDDKAAEGRNLLVASVAAPGGAVWPAGDQVAPAEPGLAFVWSVQVERAGEIEVIPSLAVRRSAEADEVLWARSFEVDVRTVAGLDASGLVVATAIATGLGIVLVVVGIKERNKWTKPRADSRSSL